MAGSLLDGLKARRDQLIEEQQKLLPVPAWSDPEIKLRVKPMDHATIKRLLGIMEKRSGASTRSEKQAEAEVDGNSALLAAATVGVLVGDHAEVPLSDDDLMEGLGVPAADSGAAVIRAMVVKEGDIFALSNAVMKLSGYSEQLVEESLQGE